MRASTGGHAAPLSEHTQTHNGAVVPPSTTVLRLHNVSHDEACRAREGKRPIGTGGGERGASSHAGARSRCDLRRARAALPGRARAADEAKQRQRVAGVSCALPRTGLVLEPQHLLKRCDASRLPRRPRRPLRHDCRRHLRLARRGMFRRNRRHRSVRRGAHLHSTHTPECRARLLCDGQVARGKARNFVRVRKKKKQRKRHDHPPDHGPPKASPQRRSRRTAGAPIVCGMGGARVWRGEVWAQQ